MQQRLVADAKQLCGLLAIPVRALQHATDGRALRLERAPAQWNLAGGGLNEIGEMSLGLQAKLLQVLQDDAFSRLGGNDEIRVDARVVCVTNRELDDMVRDGSFREDLFLRLDVVNVALPRLRERREEIPLLVEAFAVRRASRYRLGAWWPSEELTTAFDGYPFPGNVRELESMVKRIIVLEPE